MRGLAASRTRASKVPAIQARSSGVSWKRREPSLWIDAEEFLASAPEPARSLAADSADLAAVGEGVGTPGRDDDPLGELRTANGPSCPSAAVVPNAGETAVVGPRPGSVFGPAPVVEPGVPAGPVGSASEVDPDV
jgi:hypothetical protein